MSILKKKAKIMKSQNILKQIKHKSVIFLTIASLLVSSLSLIPLVIADETPQIQEDITVDTAYYMIKHQKKYPDLIILDVRDSIEYKLGHLYEAILIPLDDIEARISELEGFKNSEIIIYCKSGYRSNLAREILVEYGFAKVYNMLGGILAWIDSDYPIWTTSHYITVDEITYEKFELLIEPLLLYYSGCHSCSENRECSSQSESISITSEVLEQGEDHKIVLITYELNGITYEYIFTYTLLWSYNKITSKVNKSAYFISTEITSDDFYAQFYQLDCLIYHENYNLTIHTHLDPLNSETYNNSSTSIKYTPANGKAITSMEFVQFNIPVILSQQYDILADIAEEMAEIYKKSEDLDLMELYDGYTNMGEEIRSLSELIKKQLGEYDFQILESYAVLMDVPVPPNGGGNGGEKGCFGGDPYWDCEWCVILCEVSLVVGCFIGCAPYPPSCVICLEMMMLVEWLHIGCYAVCVLIECC